jgi:guanylate kinase
MSSKGLLFVVSAPSGTGKTTVVEELVKVVPGLELSRSYTSRPRRSNERDGVDYNFVSREDFEQRIFRGEFLEHADVFGNYYGTCRVETEARLESGRDLMLVIDVQGARQVRSQLPSTVGIFVMPPSFQILEQRLRQRSQDSDAAMARRLATAKSEVSAWEEYDYVVINDELVRCVSELAGIVLAERLRRFRRDTDVLPILKTFE